MERDELVAYCLGKPGAEETYPWGEAELVAKVGGKAFAFIGLDGGTVGVKCGRDAAEAAEWRDRDPGAGTMRSSVGGYGWHSVDLTGPGARGENPQAIDTPHPPAAAAAPESPRPRAPPQGG